MYRKSEYTKKNIVSSFERGSLLLIYPENNHRTLFSTSKPKLKTNNSSGKPMVKVTIKTLRLIYFTPKFNSMPMFYPWTFSGVIEMKH